MPAGACSRQRTSGARCPKETEPITERLDATPRTGQSFLDEEGTLQFRRAALDWHQLQDESHCFFLRIYGPGDYRWKGADLGVVVVKGRLQEEVPPDSDGGPSQLTERARRLIAAIRSQYAGTPVDDDAQQPVGVGLKSGSLPTPH